MQGKRRTQEAEDRGPPESHQPKPKPWLSLALALAHSAVQMMIDHSRINNYTLNSSFF